MESFKKYLISSFKSLPITCDMKGSKIVLVTQAGVIIGTPLATGETDKAIQSLEDITTACALEYRRENSIPDSQYFDGNDGCISLKDVQFKSGGTTYTFNFLNVFYDQIIGITLFDQK